MIRAEFICICRFIFEEMLPENEVNKTEDFEGFSVCCPRCGEEAALRSWGRAAEGTSRRETDGS